MAQNKVFAGQIESIVQARFLGSNPPISALRRGFFEQM
jgi:hypothetical protein